MSKTASGILLTFGILLALAGGVFAGTAAGVDNTPDQDWLFDLIRWGGIGASLFGVVLFFVGAKSFAAK